jgi:SNF2 family DNA or RNA helicase
MPIKLRDFQLAGVEKIRENEKNSGHGSILAYDMGLGKTLTMSSFLIQQRLSESPIYPDLIVVPLCVLTQWQKEILRVDEDMDIYIYHGPDRVATLKKMKVKPDFVITTYRRTGMLQLESSGFGRGSCHS